jgi:hypothetical protein
LKSFPNGSHKLTEIIALIELQQQCIKIWDMRVGFGHYNKNKMVDERKAVTERGCQKKCSKSMQFRQEQLFPLIIMPPRYTGGFRGSAVVNIVCLNYYFLKSILRGISIL